MSGASTFVLTAQRSRRVCLRRCRRGARARSARRDSDLAVVLVGDNPASQTYVVGKSRAAKACGFHSIQHNLPAETGEAELLALIETLNADPAVHGILVQLPLGHIDFARSSGGGRAGEGR